MSAVMRETYGTKEIADAVGIHTNTVRFYEKIGFLTKPERRANGYRVYTRVQLEQCRLIRCAMRAEVLQNGLRKKAVEIVRLCADGDCAAASAAAAEYRQMAENEIRRASAAAAYAENMPDAERRAAAENPSLRLGRRAAAERLGVTPETLRTWERNGLLRVGRSENGYRVYTASDLERLNVIRTLRCADYSLTAIRRLLCGLDADTGQPAEVMLNAVGQDDDIVSVCDRLLVSLKRTAEDAETLAAMLEKNKSVFSTIQ